MSLNGSGSNQSSEAADRKEPAKIKNVNIIIQRHKCVHVGMQRQKKAGNIRHLKGVILLSVGAYNTWRTNIISYKNDEYPTRFHKIGIADK